jgi:hypothetical protein
MKTISGYVLVQETNFGVPNLVVAAYDSDTTIQDIHKRGISPELIQQLGKRIGSVLTDHAGLFALTTEALDFPGNESRPDLLVIVFAPEDVQSVQQPYPLPPEKRVLYISTVPRADAGAAEVFVIRLLQAQLDQFRILADTAAKQSGTDSNRLAQSIQSTWAFRDSLRGRLQPRLQEEQKKSDKFTTAAREKVKNLSAIPLHLRDNKLRSNNFLIKDKSGLKDLKTIQDNVLSDGLKRLGHYKPTLHLYLTKGDLADLGLKEDRGKLAGKVDPRKLADKVRSLMKGVDLVRVRGFANPSPDALEQKYLTGLTANNTANNTRRTPTRPQKKATHVK